MSKSSVILASLTFAGNACSMNNPGLKKPISNAANQAKKSLVRDRQSGPGYLDGHCRSLRESTQVKEQRKFAQPLLWWYASTAIPLVSGAAGPMANAFSICALVENWRVVVPTGGSQEHGRYINDPNWLLVLNSCALASALFANLFLLLNMARRIRFDIALATTILGFWTAGVIHVVSVGIASHRLGAYHVQTEALSQAYYYAIFAAALYQVVSYLLCLTAWGAYSNHYQKQFRLTMAQRTLMVQTMAFLVYEWLGALVYATIEGWRFLDALYWSNLTILTVGLGDLYVPTTTLGRALLFPYALIGVIFVGLVIGSIRSLVLDKARVRTSARVAEKLRLNRITGVSRGKATKHSLPDELLQTNREESAFLPNRAELLRQMAEFNTMRTIQKSAHRRRDSIDLSISVAAVAILWTIGAVVFWITERKQKWNYFESLYFCYTTLMTIGYGDYRPESNSGKPFFVFWSLLAVPSLTILISNLGETAVRWLKDLTIWVGEITLHPSKRGSLGRGLLRNKRRIIRRVIGGSKRRGDPETGTLRHQLQNLGQVHTEVANLSDLVSRPRHMCGIAYGR